MLLAASFGLAIAAVLGAPAVAQPPRLEKAELEPLAELTSYAAGDSARLAGRMTIEDGWHTNSHQPTFEYLIPTTLEVRVPAGWPQPRIDYPAGEMKTFAFEEEPLSVYEGEVLFDVRIDLPDDAPSGVRTLAFDLTYQACDDRSCLPPVSVSRDLELTIGGRGEVSAAWRATGGGGAPAGGPSLAWILVAGLIGGLILNAMPCVLPVLSLKLLGLVKASGQSRRQVTVGALATASGILVSFWGLALAAIVARRAGAAAGWGVQFQEPTFVAALAVLVVLFSLNLWGLFEIALPGFLARAGDRAERSSKAGHFLAGLFATLMATPCSAPFLGTAVGFALSQTTVTILAVFTAIGLGMALPYLTLAVAPGAARLLPRPGVWMQHLKVVMGFLLAGAAVWLLYVLSAQISPERLAFVEISLLMLALACWVFGQAQRRRLIRSLSLVGMIAIAIGTVVVANDSGRTPSRDRSAKSQQLLDWIVFDRAEAEALSAAGRMVFVDVTADWCFTCKVNERLVLETEEVAAAFREHDVVAMKADWTNRDPEIADFLADHGRYGIPFYLLYRPGDDAHLFGELLTRSSLIEEIDRAAASTPRIALGGKTSG